MISTRKDFSFKIHVAVFALFLCCFSGLAQLKDTTASFKFGGYADAYYAYYTDSVGIKNYQKFPAISPRSNVFSLNVLQLTAQYTSAKIRSSAAIFYGDIPSSAWSPVFNFIQEANVGFRLSKKVWLDAGLFKTHIGTEALLPKDNITSSLSIITVYEPWFQSGLKLDYTPSDKLSFCLHLLNGYNTFVETNSKKSVGITAIYKLGDKGNIGYYNLMGDDTPDGIKTSHFRVLNNLAFNYDVTPKIKLSIGLDYISQTNSGIRDSTKMASIYSAIVTMRYQLKSKLGIYGRWDMYNDQDGFLSGRIVDSRLMYTGYVMNGITAGLEYKVAENSYIRLEGRQLIMDSNQKIFYSNGNPTNQRSEIMLHAGIWFNK
ncbi:MAG: outer membrane beta-barrel protein [Bacteroidia bacterium]